MKKFLKRFIETLAVSFLLPLAVFFLLPLVLVAVIYLAVCFCGWDIYTPSVEWVYIRVYLILALFLSFFLSLKD